MKNSRIRNVIFSLILLILILGVYWYRKNNKPVAVELRGETQGTTYSVKYNGKNAESYQKEVDSILVAFSNSLSTYIPDSEISKFNKNTIHKFESSFFYPVLKRAKEIYKETNGAFDPSVKPIVDAYGFGPKGDKDISGINIDSLLKLVNFDSIFFDSVSVCKLQPNMEIDFNAIAQGYSVDIIADFLESKNISNYMVEIGGEVKCKGKNEQDKIWTIGINNPEYEEKGGDFFQQIVQLKDIALATSGNYRKYYVKDGRKYSHTIDPKTGKMVQHNLLSTSVFAKDCMTADAYATAFMVMGMEKSIDFVESRNNLEVIFIYSDGSGKLKSYISEGLIKFIIDTKNKDEGK
jgi:FAD:protein FMN transferase